MVTVLGGGQGLAEGKEPWVSNQEIGSSGQGQFTMRSQDPRACGVGMPYLA